MPTSLEIQLKTLPDSPGVYQYYDKEDIILYVGKAKNLKKRVASYFTKNHENAKTRILVNKIVSKESLDGEVNAIAESLSKLAPGTMQIGLEAYAKQDDKNFDEAMPYLQDQIARCFEGDDAKEGISAFLEKREPNWD